MVAVISADLLGSTDYPNELMERVLNTLNREFQNLKHSADMDPGFRIFRGDSFQGVIYEPSEALLVSMQFKTAINRLHLKESDTNKAFKREADLRLSIGIGTYNFRRESILESNGEAFQFSGRTLDEMKKEQRKLKIRTPIANINEEFNTSFYLFETLSEKWSTASAEVIYYLLKCYKETEVANELDISQSAVNQRKKAAGWDAIEALLDRYQKVISSNFPNGK